MAASGDSATAGRLIESPPQGNRSREIDRSRSGPPVDDDCSDLACVLCTFVAINSSGEMFQGGVDLVTQHATKGFGHNQ